MSEKLLANGNQYDNFFEVDGIRFRGQFMRDINNSLGVYSEILDKQEAGKVALCLRVKNRESLWRRFLCYYLAGLHEQVELEINPSCQDGFLKDVYIDVEGVCYWLHRDESGVREVDLSDYNSVFRFEQDVEKVYKVGKVGFGVSLFVTVLSWLLFTFVIPISIPAIVANFMIIFLSTRAVKYYGNILCNYKRGGQYRKIYEAKNNESKALISIFRLR